MTPEEIKTVMRMIIAYNTNGTDDAIGYLERWNNPNNHLAMQFAKSAAKLALRDGSATWTFEERVALANILSEE